VKADNWQIPPKRPLNPPESAASPKSASEQASSGAQLDACDQLGAEGIQLGPSATRRINERFPAGRKSQAVMPS